MLYTMSEILKDAQEKKYGVGYFNCINLEMTRAYIQAAEDCHSPIIIGTSEGLTKKYVPFDWIAPLLLYAARKAKVPVAVHLDHTYHFEVLMQALRAGFGSVMFDGSQLSYEENIAVSRKIADIAHPMGVGLECELGYVGGIKAADGTIPANVATDPEIVPDFVERTQADFLAVSIGTVHGVYATTPHLDLERLGQIREKISLPLVLHGGSGLSDEDFAATIAGGISKVNIFTDVITAGAECLNEAKEMRYPDMQKASTAAMYEATVKKLKCFGSTNRY